MCTAPYNIFNTPSRSPRQGAKWHQKSKVKVSSVSLTAALQWKCGSIDLAQLSYVKRRKKEKHNIISNQLFRYSKYFKGTSHFNLISIQRPFCWSGHRLDPLMAEIASWIDMCFHIRAEALFPLIKDHQFTSTVGFYSAALDFYHHQIHSHIPYFTSLIKQKQSQIFISIDVGPRKNN